MSNKQTLLLQMMGSKSNIFPREISKNIFVSSPTLQMQLLKTQIPYKGLEVLGVSSFLDNIAFCSV